MNDGTNQPPPYDQPTAQYIQPPYGQPLQPPPYGQPQYGQQPPYGPPPMYVQPPQKKSRRWLWITLSVVGGLLVLACAGCGILGVIGFNFAAKVVGPAVVSANYYSALSKQDYATAYSYLDTNTASIQGHTLTEQEYAQVVQIVDTTQGKITKSSSLGFNAGTSNTATVTMKVTRTSRTYDVQLQLKKIGNDWKIVSVDRL